MIKFNQFDKPDLKFNKAIKKPIPVECYQMDKAFEVETLEGTMTGKKGDWLMKGVDGELYPCDQDIFDKTYTIIE
jgi:hypothetical protein